MIASEPLDEISSAWYRWKALDLSFQIMIFSILSVRGGARPGRPPLYEPLCYMKQLDVDVSLPTNILNLTHTTFGLDQFDL